MRPDEDAGAELDDLCEDCSSLSQHAALSRYPGAFTYQDRIGKDAAAAAERVYSRLKAVLAAGAK
jgi:hypothetical protein